MTPNKVRQARLMLGLSLPELARLLGYSGRAVAQMMWLIESGKRRLRDPQRRLLAAYLEGYRPIDWPKR